MTSINLHVVIPCLGLEALTRACLLTLERALEKTPSVKATVTLVDNASPFVFRREYFPRDLDIDIARIDRQASFSKACNLGATRNDEADFYLFLNNDVLLHEDSLVDLFRCQRDFQAGITGMRLVFADSTIQHCGVLFDDGDRGPYHTCHKVHTSLVPRTPRELQAVTGAVFLVKRELFSALNGFSEDYSFGYEDIDFCLRAKQLGATIACAQEIDSIHFANTSYNETSMKRINQSRMVFMANWRGRFQIDGNRDEL